MLGVRSARIGLALLLAWAIGWCVPVVRGDAQGAPVAPPLAEGPGTMLGAPEIVTLSRDTGLAGSYSREWEAGDAVALLLRASPAQFPLTIQAAHAYLNVFPGADPEVLVRAHIYRATPAGPGELLASSEAAGPGLAAVIPGAPVVLPFPGAGLTLFQPQEFYLVLTYETGSEDTAPAVWSDASAELPTHVAYYRLGTGAWVEHHAFWASPSQVGYPMLRAVARTSGGAADITQSSAVDDTFVVSRIPAMNRGDQAYMQAGHDAVWEVSRMMLRFELPPAPVAGAVPLSATLRLFHDQQTATAGQTQPMTMTAHAIIGAWTQDAATWTSHSEAFDPQVEASAVIPAFDPGGGPRDYMISWDISALFRRWWQGSQASFGVMLRGREDLADSLKRFGAQERAEALERPVLLVQWALPTPEVTHTPQPSPTATRLTLPNALFVPLIWR